MQSETAKGVPLCLLPLIGAVWPVAGRTVNSGKAVLAVLPCCQCVARSDRLATADRDLPGGVWAENSAADTSARQPDCKYCTLYSWLQGSQPLTGFNFVVGSGTI